MRNYAINKYYSCNNNYNAQNVGLGFVLIMLDVEDIVEDNLSNNFIIGNTTSFRDRLCIYS